MTKFSVLCIGAGALGTYVGGSLAVAGHKVVFLEQPGMVIALQVNGLRLHLQDGEHRIPAPVVADHIEKALEKGPFDVALFALKSFDTLSALQPLASYREDLPPFLCLQNGVENEQIIAQTLGPEKVIAGTVTSAIGRRANSEVILERLRGLGVAAWHLSTRPEFIAQLTHTLFAAGLQARQYNNAADMKWSKLLTNLLGNATSAILDITPGEVFGHPGLFRLEIEQLRECLRVMRAMTISVVDLPGTPVRALAFGASTLPLALARPLFRRGAGSGRGNKMPSFHIDLHSKRGKSEVDYLNGAVVRFGQKNGIPTPINQALNETLLALTSSEMPLQTFAKQPKKLLQHVASL
jgi:2-dehydropantoate 2-reductase